MRNCPRCGGVYQPPAQRCNRCGYELDSLAPKRPSEDLQSANRLVLDYLVVEELDIDRGFCKSYVVEKEGNRYLLKAKKITSKQNAGDAILTAFQEETEFLRKIDVISLPAIVGSFSREDQLYLVLTYPRGTSLLQKIYPKARSFSTTNLGHPNRPELNLIPLWARQLATTLNQLHSQIPFPILHRNLAPDTIYVSENNNIELLDFGFLHSFKAASNQDDWSASQTRYLFRDSLSDTLQKSDDSSRDIYSYGRLLDFILTGAIPASPTDSVKISQINDSFATSDPRYYLSKIIARCCTSNISDRYPSMDVVLEDLYSLYERTGSIETEAIQCESCGYSNRISAHFCARCGNLLKPSSNTASSSALSIQLSYDETAQANILRSFTESRMAPLRIFRLRESLDRVQADPGLDALICIDSLTKVQKMPHQQEAALNVLRQKRGRALLADEVGLGKTIEAGLILKELLLRKLANSILILCPPQLVAQWQIELFEKFDELFLVMGINVDSSLAWRCDRLIAPYPIIEQRFHAEEFLRFSYDLVILDEAHYLNEPTNWKILQNVQNLKKKYFLLLSATPMHNEVRELYNIITLLRPGHFGDWNSFSSRFLVEKRQFRVNQLRTKDLLNKLLKASIIENLEKVDEEPADAEVDERFAEFSEHCQDEESLSKLLKEADINGSVGNTIKELWKKSERKQVAVKNAPELREILLQVMVRNMRVDVAKDYPFPIRRATRYELELSPAAKVFYDQFHRFYRKGLRKVRNRYFQYQMGEIVERLSSSPDAFSHGVRHRLKAKIKRQLGESFVNELERFASTCPPELVKPKLLKAFERTQHFVNQGDKVLIFSQFNETTKYAHAEMNSSPEFSDTAKISMLYDENDEDANKFQILRKFLSIAGPAVLFCPAEISEGVNLQRARVMINLDLPWDPMKIEQRIGRIQRLDGHREVIIINLVLKNTIEEDILRILEQKIQMFEAVIGKVEEIIGNLSQSDDFRAMICDLYMDNKIETEEGQTLTAQQRIEQALQTAIQRSSSQETENLLNKVLKQETKDSIFFKATEDEQDDW